MDKVLTSELVQGAAEVLRGEVAPPPDLHQGDVTYRQDLAVNLLYKVPDLVRHFRSYPRTEHFLTICSHNTA